MALDFPYESCGLMSMHTSNNKGISNVKICTIQGNVDIFSGLEVQVKVGGLIRTLTPYLQYLTWQQHMTDIYKTNFIQLTGKYKIGKISFNYWHKFIIDPFSITMKFVKSFSENNIIKHQVK